MWLRKSNSALLYLSIFLVEKTAVKMSKDSVEQSGSHRHSYKNESRSLYLQEEKSILSPPLWSPVRPAMTRHNPNNPHTKRSLQHYQHEVYVYFITTATFMSSRQIAGPSQKNIYYMAKEAMKTFTANSGYQLQL